MAFYGTPQGKRSQLRGSSEYGTDIDAACGQLSVLIL